MQLLQDIEIDRWEYFEKKYDLWKKWAGKKLKFSLFNLDGTLEYSDAMTELWDGVFIAEIPSKYSSHLGSSEYIAKVIWDDNGKDKTLGRWSVRVSWIIPKIDEWTQKK